jgi:hypothetical protein
MISKIEVERFRLTSSRPVDEVLASIKGAVGHPDMVEFVFFSRKEHRYANDRCLRRRRHIRRQEQTCAGSGECSDEVGGRPSTDLFKKNTAAFVHELLAIYPERVNPAVLWLSARAIKPAS